MTREKAKTTDRTTCVGVFSTRDDALRAIDELKRAGFKDDQYSQLVAGAASEPDAAKRKQIYSQLNDYILDQSFGIPIAPSTSRVITKAAVHGIEFRMNDVMTFANTWRMSLPCRRWRPCPPQGQCAACWPLTRALRPTCRSSHAPS